MNQNINQKNEHPDIDGPLETAVWAVIDEKIPADAVERVKQRAIDAAAQSQPTVRREASHGRASTILRWAIAASVLAVALGGFAWLGGPFGSTSLYAQVAQKLEGLKSMVCQLQFSETGMLDHSLDLKNGQFKVSYLAPSLHRLENDLGVEISDVEQNRVVALTPQEKKAMVFEGPLAAATDATSPVRLVEALMRHVQVDRANDENVRSLGRRTINGVTLIGYESKIDSETLHAWFDSETLLPSVVALRFEIPEQLAGGDAQPMWQMLTDIKVNVDLPRELFDTRVPEGYQELSVDLSIEERPPSIDVVIELLQMCAQANDSQFPASLSMNDDEGTPVAIMKKAADDLEQKVDQANDEEMAAALRSVSQFGSALGGATGFLLSLQPENDLNYFGGATLNEMDRPILWFSPEGDDNYKVVYADLTVEEDVARDDLPPKPESVVQPSSPKNVIRLSTPSFALPKSAVTQHDQLQQIRKEGKQADVRFLNLSSMTEFEESQFESKAAGSTEADLTSPPAVVAIETVDVDPKWKPNRSGSESRLAFLKEFSNLEGLNVSGLYLTQGDLEVIGGCENLKRLSLNSVQVFDSSSRLLNGDDLAKLSNLQSLELLDLSRSNFLGGLKHLADLPRLRTVYLNSFENLNDASVAELSELPNLETLVLAADYLPGSEKSVGESGLQSLANLPQLKTLYVGHRKFMLPVDRLKELLPNVDVRSPDEGLNSPTR